MDTLSSYFSTLPAKHFKKGEIVLMQGDIPECAYGIKKGIVKIYNLTSEGEEKCLSYDMTSGIFPICWVFSKTDKALFYYQAHTDCEVGVIDKKAFHEKLLSNPTFLYETLSEQMAVYVQQMLRINGLEQPRAATKLLNIFQFFCLRYGKTTKKHTIKVQLPLTQQEIAQFAGLTRETIAIELKRLKQEGIVTYSRKRYVVRTDRLHERLVDGFNPGIHIASNTSDFVK